MPGEKTGLVVTIGIDADQAEGPQTPDEISEPCVQGLAAVRELGPQAVGNRGHGGSTVEAAPHRTAQLVELDSLGQPGPPNPAPEAAQVSHPRLFSLDHDPAVAFAPRRAANEYDIEW